MTADVTIKEGTQLAPHPLRAAILGEIHARPFTPIATPRRILHFAFDTAGEAAKADRAALTNFCARRELEPLKASAKHHRVTLGGATLRWEQHSEFTTYTWELPSEPRTPFYPAASSLAGPMANVPQPGPLLVALDLHLLPDNKDKPIVVGHLFDHASLAVAENSDGSCFVRHRFPGRPIGLRARSAARPRSGAGTRRRDRAAHHRDRNLPHIGAARLAGSATAVAIDQPDRIAAGRTDRGNAQRASIAATISACSTN